MRPLFPKLHFADLHSAQSVLQGRFPDWTGDDSKPHTNEVTNECLVVVKELPRMDESGNPLPSTWEGVHIDLSLQTEAPEYETYWVSPDPTSPAHSFGE